jgi:hypothetical protein
MASDFFMILLSPGSLEPWRSVIAMGTVGARAGERVGAESCGWLAGPAGRRLVSVERREKEIA